MPTATSKPSPPPVAEVTDVPAISTSPEPAVAPATPPGTFTVRLPFLTLSVDRPVPGRSPAGPAGPRGAAGPERADLPAVERFLFYGGVAALGVVGILDWPVAAAIAAGTYVAGRARTAPSRSSAAG